MIASMTGYGKSAYTSDKKNIKVEIKSINSKQLDLSLRVPSYFRDQENILRSTVSDLLERGKIELSVSIEHAPGENLSNINRELLKAYKEQIMAISRELDIPVPNDWYQTLFRMPDVFKAESTGPDESEVSDLLDTCLEAVNDLRGSRLNEGKKLYEFFFQKLERIRGLLKEIVKFEERRIPKIRERLEENLAKLQSIEYDKGRLEQELIFYIEKLDVTEEKVRLESHLDYFEETLGFPDENQCAGKGKKLGFIAQEMGREINTLGSKANDADMQKIVVMMKDELEQIKEQVLNVL